MLSNQESKFRSLDEITNEEKFRTANKQFQMKWFTKNRNIRNVGRQPAINIVEGEIGPLGPSKDVTTPLEAWQLFVKDEFLEKTVTNTNSFKFLEQCIKFNDKNTRLER